MKRSAVSLAALVATVLGCPDQSPPLPPAAVATTVTAVAGDDQVGAAGQPLPESLTVIVRDQAGLPFSGAAVTWDVTGGGTVSPATTVTGAGGVARTRRTLGPNAGGQTARATVTSLTPVTFDAVAQIQGAVQMGAKTIGPLADTVLGTLTELEQPVNVIVLDHLNVPVPGVVVSWTATGGGTVSPATSVTNAGGEAMTEYTFGAEARSGYGAIATVTGLVGSPVVWDNMSAHPGNPVALAKTNGDGLVAQAGGPVVLTVTVRDAHGNGVPGVTVQWVAGTGGGSIAPTQNLSGNGGQAQAVRTLGSAIGEQTATASAPSLPGAPTVTFTTIAATTVVRVGNNAFNPNAVSLQAGDSVAWQWLGTTNPHTITFAAVAGAPLPEPDRTFGVVWRTFALAGTFTYQCTNHVGMTGSVTVTP